MFADICAKRQIEIQDQELRSFVVKHSVVRIHCVVAFALTLIGLELLRPAQVHANEDVLGALMAVASLVIALSTRTIGRSVANPRR
jgi:hypothetical protein